MRLFTGIAIPPTVSQALENAIAPVRSSVPIKWSKPEDWHITLKFIGQWPEERIPELAGTLAKVRPAPIEVEVSGFGYFPNPHRPHAFFAAVQGNVALGELARQLDQALVPLGCPSEDKQYKPHVTLARIKGRGAAELRESVPKGEDVQFGTFQPKAFHLYESRTNPKGASYSIIQTFPMPKEAFAG